MTTREKTTKIKNFRVPSNGKITTNIFGKEKEIYLKEVINENYQVMTGEFVKTLLKLCAINKEITNMCMEMNYVELANKLQNVENKIMKYVVTSQSLYL